MLDFRKKIIFTHPPKCGGTTIEAGFGWHPASNRELPEKFRSIVKAMFLKLKHATLDEHINELKSFNIDHAKFFKFTCVRNPWDVMVSHFLFNQNSINSEERIKKLNFDEYVEHFLGNGRFKNNKILNFSPFLFYQNKFCMDYVIKFENYEEDVNLIFHKFNTKWPSKNYNVLNMPRGHYRTFYKNLRTKEIVEEAGQDIIQMFDYKF